MPDESEKEWKDVDVATKKRQETAIIVRREAKDEDKKSKQKSASSKTRKKSSSSKSRHNTAFVVGSVIGGLAGAAAALWKTPYSGGELREKFTGGSGSSGTSGEAVQVEATARPQQQSIQSRILSTVENRLAPLVGVKLGQTANNSGPVTTTAATTTATTSTVGTATRSGFTAPSSNRPGGDGAAPAFADEEPAGQGSDAQASAGAGENVTPVDQEGGEPSGMSSPVEPAPEANAASVEDLTKPQTDLQPDALQDKDTDMHPFPTFGSKGSGDNRRN